MASGRALTTLTTVIYNPDEAYRREMMLAGFARVGAAVVVFAVIGSAFGVLLGALTDNYLLWVGVTAFIGANFGLAIGYGLLPEN